MAYGYVSGNPLAWTDWLGLCETSLWSSIKQGIGNVWVAATAWHFEGRDDANAPYETLTYEDIFVDGFIIDPLAWSELTGAQAEFHDNKDEFPEIKVIHESGAELVFNGATNELILTDKHKGTFNYVNAIPKEEVDSIQSAAAFVVYGTGHLIADVLPYLLGGNVRGDN